MMTCGSQEPALRNCFSPSTVDFGDGAEVIMTVVQALLNLKVPQHVCDYEEVGGSSVDSVELKEIGYVGSRNRAAGREGCSLGKGTCHTSMMRSSIPKKRSEGES